MARPVGFEPTALGLEVLCSIQLSYGRNLVRVEGVEPSSPVWKTGIITAIRHSQIGGYNRDNYINVQMLAMYLMSLTDAL